MSGAGVHSVGERLEELAGEIAGCRLCANAPSGKRPLPHQPRPVCVLSQTARIAICGQAPGTRVHESGRPYTDPSGDRLRAWMGVDARVFYNPALIAIVPMGFCFPGLDSKGGDLPPRRECRATWHDRVFEAMPQIELKLVIGQYAIDYHLAGLKRKTVRDTVEAWSEMMDLSKARGSGAVLPLPHPSWRNNRWLSDNPWFETQVVPRLQATIRELLSRSAGV
ncbi:uracil-DNA glycosylase family protein [Rhizobiales bacterium]|uniref:uracil-DNA glycosylase family protein n=1 Tax=Hongsoonwoonella zoysiae TaxID=2821844 RepID=UPI00156180FA|nr:uracil-DNA glycosylase family protein [Hongsoonwoonella zoysiae]NRG18336.1 uracil-DNA glycosylase family protein [Hongsoonwoonella zoysiae]